MAVVLEQLKSETYPIVKWVGGKRQLMFELLINMPNSYNRYFEPFIGGGALFFELQPQNGYISDMNEELINLYSTVKDNVYELIADLNKHEVSKEYFLEIRNLDRTEKYSTLSNIEKASRFIYLNRTCFNGLYRVNSQGQFNVPFGNYKNPRIVDVDNLINCSKLLKNTEIKCADFSAILEKVQKGDFVYFDPPYVPLNETSSFTSYTKDGFDLDMQFKLKEVCDELDSRGVMFMLSNSDTKFVNELYANYEIKKVFASRAVNANANIYDFMREPEKIKISKKGKKKLMAVRALVKRALVAMPEEKKFIGTPKDAVDIMMRRLRYETKENFYVLILNTGNRVINVSKISQGSVNAAIVNPANIFKEVLKYETSNSIVLVHNHPSGDPTPSMNDVNLTAQIIRAGKLLNIEVIDHIIIGDGIYTSFRKEEIIRGTNGDTKIDMGRALQKCERR